MDQAQNAPRVPMERRAQGLGTDVVNSAGTGADLSLLWRSPRAVALAGGLLVLATVAAYDNTFRNPFVFDDRSAIRDNPTIRSLWPLWPALWPPANGSVVQRRPVVNLSLAINYAISGYRVWSYHAFNLAAHALAGLVLFGVVRRTLLLPAFRHRFAEAAMPLAFAVALLWLVHPLQTEAVTYVIQRTEVLAGLFYLLTLYCVIRGSSARRSASWYVAAAAACALAMGSKESAISVPLVVLLFDRVFLSASWREVFRRRWGLYLGLAASWTVILGMLPRGSEGAAVFSITRGSEGAAVAGEHGRTIDYTLVQSGVIGHYLRLCFWPHPLLFDYGFYTPQPAGQIIPHALLIGALLAATAAAFRYWPWLGFLGVWFFAILAPSSSFVPLFQQYAAEKRMYLPLAAVVTGVVVGGFLAGRWLVGRGTVSRRHMQHTGAVAVILTSITLGILTFQRNQDYRSALSIWQDTVTKLPQSYRAHTNIAQALVDCGRNDEAVAHYRKSVELRPDKEQAHYNLGTALSGCGRVDEAIACFRKALEINADSAHVHNNLGLALASRGQFDEAIAHFRKLIELKPEGAQAYYNLAKALADYGQLDAAIAEYQKAVEIEPDFAGAHYNLAVILVKQSQFDKAIPHYRKALELKPGHPSGHMNFGDILRERGQIDEAIGQYRIALQVDPQNALARKHLDTALARQSSLQQTLTQQRQRLQAHPDDTAAWNDTAWTLATNPNRSLRNGQEAVTLARRAVELSGGRDPSVLDTLAAAYAEAGQWPEAMQTAEQALSLATQQAKPALSDALRARMTLYESKRPWRDLPPVAGASRALSGDNTKGQSE